MRIKNILLHIIKISLPISVEDNDINIEKNSNGYYSTDIALFLSKKINSNSIDIANDIKNKIDSDFIDNIIVLDSGIINIYLNIKFLMKNVENIIDDGKKFGKSNYGKGKRISDGYINLFSDRLGIDVAHLVAYGDSLSRIMVCSGYDVTRECYIGMEDYSIEKIKRDLDKYRVSFDMFSDRDSLATSGILDSSMMCLQKSGKCYIKNDALWLKVSDLYGNSDIVLVDADGSYTEIFFDIAYYIDRFTRKYDKIVDICLENSDNYVNIIKAALTFSGCNISNYEIKRLSDFNLEDKIEFIEYGELEDLINRYGVNELRYYFSSYNSNDYFTSKKLKFSVENDICYLDKINSTIYSILRKKDYINMDKIGTMDNVLAYTILNKLLELEEKVIAASDGSINIIGKYLYDLACLFEEYFDEKMTSEKLHLIEAIHVCMNNTANMIGLILREEK